MLASSFHMRIKLRHALRVVRKTAARKHYTALGKYLWPES